MVRALKLDGLDILIESLKKDYLVYAPLSRNGDYFFSILEEEKAYLGCAVTIMPPKRILQPEVQTLFNYTAVDGYSIETPPLDQKQALFGIRPCDVHAMLGFDRVFGGRYEDPYWWERRKNTLVVAANCTTVAEECFCSSWGTGPGLDANYDLLLTDLEDGYLLEIGSPAGEEVAIQLDVPPAGEADLSKKARLLARATASIKKVLGVKPTELHDFLAERFDHPAWQPQADVCFSCGNCTITCPTCYCYNIFEDYSPALKAGERRSEWDSCQLLEFARIAHGFNFRRTRLDRFKHRSIHKLSWMDQQYQTPGCVGCGRCVRWCPSWPVRRGRPTSLADPVEIIGDLMEAV
ncbi:MAG: 4Fe-4S dicluster domain-containing protein [Actinobacteria bacterium]|nr:4Fe-4S dicluster domain-containing protein [Actinomycetota bacterium]